MHAKSLKHLATVGSRQGGWSIFLCLACLCWTCQNKNMAELYAKPKALGTWLEVGIVAQDSVWKSPFMDSLRRHWQDSLGYPCLPIAPEDTIHFAGLHRNLVYINLSKKTFQTLDAKALGQTAQYIQLDTASATQWENIRAYIWKHEKERLRVFKYAFEAHQSTALERWVAKRYPFRVRLLPELQVWKQTQTSLWLKNEKGAGKHFYFVQTPTAGKAILPFKSVQNFTALPARYASFTEGTFYYDNKAYQFVSTWKKGYQATLIFETKTFRNTLQRLELEALLETLE